MVSTKVILSAIALIGICIFMVAEAKPSYSDTYDIDEGSQERLMQLVERFGEALIRAQNNLEYSKPSQDLDDVIRKLEKISSSNSNGRKHRVKRNIDFGLARGYSGTQEAKHRLGMAAAMMPYGPGRKRRAKRNLDFALAKDYSGTQNNQVLAGMEMVKTNKGSDRR